MIQVKVIPEDFFEDEVSRENFLRPSFVSLLRNAREEAEHLPSSLRDEVERFSRAVARRFRGLDLESAIEEEEMDEAPCVVPIEDVHRALGEMSLTEGLTDEGIVVEAKKTGWHSPPVSRCFVMETVPEETEQ